MSIANCRICLYVYCSARSSGNQYVLCTEVSVGLLASAQERGCISHPPVCDSWNKSSVLLCLSSLYLTRATGAPVSLERWRKKSAEKLKKITEASWFPGGQSISLHWSLYTCLKLILLHLGLMPLFRIAWNTFYCIPFKPFNQRPWMFCLPKCAWRFQIQ